MTHNYRLMGDKVVEDKWGVNQRLVFMYDENGAPNTVYYYNGSTSATKYYYVLNLQGDVTEIRSTSNALVAQYNYDAFGNILSIKDANGNNITSSTHIANVNPLRYRGYFYDTETGFYYLNSRYYDPATRRFISADSVINTGDFQGFNLYAYCGNNPVMKVDQSGYSWSSIFEFVRTAVTETGRIMGTLSPAYAGCGGVAAVDGPLPFGDIAGIIGAAALTVGAISVGIYEASKAQTKVKVEEKEVAVPSTPSDKVTTYYHVTTPENAASIIASGVMTGSSWEGGYVYAWLKQPNMYAIKNSGAHMGVIISFETTACFTMDTGIDDPKVLAYGPVVSVIPSPIVVWNAKIVGVTK